VAMTAATTRRSSHLEILRPSTRLRMTRFLHSL
jgi:hypothetical protein